ncbi:phosphoribosyl-AMP cyclohydrolase, partial [Klebsiella pneumoniae]
TAVATDRVSGDVLMLAHMNAEALRLTVESGEAHFWSRSRSALWKKGETSGHVLRVADIRIDCDQDAVWLIVDPAGPACHTGERSCFYRRIDGD